jgi:hypothetical protein
MRSGWRGRLTLFLWAAADATSVLFRSNQVHADGNQNRHRPSAQHRNDYIVTDNRGGSDDPDEDSTGGPSALPLRLIEERPEPLSHR